MDEIIDKLKQQIAIEMELFGELSNEASWGHESGVLLSGQEAQELVTQVEALRNQVKFLQRQEGQ